MYIRTKDGVYEVEQSQLEDDEEVVNCDYGQIHKLEILRKSENLEELCDEFVLINNNVFTVPQIITYTNFQNTKTYREDYGKFETIYGAIWTSKGLIYVAKMNEKGELVLI